MPAASTSCDFGIELALDVTLRHLGGGEDLFDLPGLTRGVELLQPLFANLGHCLHRGVEIFARIQLFRVAVLNLSYLPGHPPPLLGVPLHTPTHAHTSPLHH